MFILTFTFNDDLLDIYNLKIIKNKYVYLIYRMPTISLKSRMPIKVVSMKTGRLEKKNKNNCKTTQG